MAELPTTLAKPRGRPPGRSPGHSLTQDLAILPTEQVQRLQERIYRLAHQAIALVEKRIDEAGDKASLQQLVVTFGVATDKWLALERAKNPDAKADPGLTRMLDRLAQLGGGKVSFQLEPHQPQPEAITAHVIEDDNPTTAQNTTDDSVDENG